MSTAITVQLLDLPWASGKFAAVLDNVFSAEECEALVARGEAAGFDAALVNVGGGLELLKRDIRNSDRAIVDCPETTRLLWGRIKSALAAAGDGSGLEALRNVPASGWTAVGLNERMRIRRYDQGHFFAAHYDGSYTRRGNDLGGRARAGETSFVTCQLYLSEGMQGGATRFSNEARPSEFYDVAPRVGRVLLFDHHMYHEGAPLVRGRKYCLRTDLMYAGGADKAHLDYCVTPIAAPVVAAGSSFKTP